MIASVLLFAQMVLGTGQDPKTFPPAHCGKYQHVVHHPAYSSGVPCDTGTNAVGCVAVAVYHEAEPDSCSNDMHEVTEQQWQDLMDRLRLLDSEWQDYYANHPPDVFVAK